VVITLERWGGFAGLRRTVRIDSAALPARDRARLRRAVESAGLLAPAPAAPPRTPGPDRLRYRLTIEDGAARHQVRVDEERAGPALLALVSLVEGLAR
jgi:hypothetical protein